MYISSDEEDFDIHKHTPTVPYIDEEDLIMIHKDITPEEASNMILAFGYYNNYEPIIINDLVLTMIGNVSDYHNDFHGNNLFYKYKNEDNESVYFNYYQGEGYFQFNPDIRPDEAKIIVEIGYELEDHTNRY